MNIDRINIQYRRISGFYLPVIFGVLAVVIVMSTQLGLFLSDYYQNITVKMQKDSAFEIARKSVLAAERALDSTNVHPDILATLRDASDGTVSVFEREVWEDTLITYDLTLAKDPISNDSLKWWQQPESWWKKYTYQLNNEQISDELLGLGRGYVAVEYVKKYDFDDDFSLSRNYSSGIYASVFRITAAGFSHSGQKSIVTSLYVHTYAY
ncbi:MAG TPA: hypothetical protein DHW71_09310 [Gammaproteobacteria bacterium]|nr:hypothetical protein [Gammaproteobacteria bacterium]MEC8009162.1 hypothetical protein [Pseudomonadota bacterium]HBF08372.1 hypothetical protein [Gammaproteobacteria bacterium]HCK93173.1 hypothetical protein [Gammaproteobacteria bacterium]